MDSKPVILVVDDDGPILLLMQNLLRELGFRPVTASSGAQALTLARNARPDLVLLDKNMPGMNGGEVVTALRGEKGLEQLPILILSGEPVTRDELAALGVNGAVQKPFDIGDLLEKIRANIGAAK
jgi:two-component system, OmpR family, KDP operon response regulator KdpE